MRIGEYNIELYLKEAYGGTPVLKQQKHIAGFKPLLQRNYGGDNDCTLTSITAIVSFLSKYKYPIKDVYAYVEKIAKKYLYRGTSGTPFITIRKIFHESLKHYKLPQAYVKYLKGVGYNFKDIQNAIKRGTPLVLSMANDGRDYYTNHSITIIGYDIYKINGKEVKMIAVYDNWYAVVSYVDYDKISKISSIQYPDITASQRFDMWRLLKNLK